MFHVVSIHALLAECDPSPAPSISIPIGFNPRTPCGVRRKCKCKCKCSTWFQSTHSLRSATASCNGFHIVPTVSIHALLAECDPISCTSYCCTPGFNPRTPCGVRLRILPSPPPGKRFQSTHSLRSATFRYRWGDRQAAVSIHALLAECDAYTTVTAAGETGFNPRTPCGVRRNRAGVGIGLREFQSTHSLRSATGQPGNENTN